MALNLGFQKIAEFTTISFETTILLILFFAGIIFYAKSVRLGLMLHMVAFACAFMMFYALHLAYGYALVAFFVTLVVMAFSLFMGGDKSTAGVA
jgi:hypothetical protein